MMTLDAYSVCPKRKPNRLKGYDYSQYGYYFITICTDERKQYLCHIVGDTAHGVPSVVLTQAGKIVSEIISRTNTVYQNVKLANYIIMPNHVHLIIAITNEDDALTSGNGTPRAASPTKDIPAIISTFKHLTNRQCGFQLWQRSFHDRVIRNEHEYLKIWNYIDTNPARWESDCFYNSDNS